MIAKNRKLRKQKSIQNTFLLAISSLFAFVVVLLLIFSNWKIGQQKKELSNKVESLKKEITSLEEKNEQIKKEISQLTNFETFEKEAREKFNLSKPGEKVVIISPISKTEEKEKKSQEKKNLWQIILEKIGF